MRCSNRIYYELLHHGQWSVRAKYSIQAFELHQLEKPVRDASVILITMWTLAVQFIAKVKSLFARTSPTSTMFCLFNLTCGQVARTACHRCRRSRFCFYSCRKACHCNLDHIHTTSRCSSPVCFLCVPSQYFMCSYAQFPIIKSPSSPNIALTNFFFYWITSKVRFQCL